MFSPRRRTSALIILVLTALLVMEPLPILAGGDRGAPTPNFLKPFQMVASAFTRLPGVVGDAAGAVGSFFGGLLSGPDSAAAAKPQTSPSPTATPEPVELVNKRTRDSKTFKNPNGSLTTEFGRYIHYKDEQGNWKEVDLNFRPSGADKVMDRHDLKVKVKGSAIEVTEKKSGKGIRFPLPAQPTVDKKEVSFTGTDGRTWHYANTKAGVTLAVTIPVRVGPHHYEFPYELLGGAAALEVDENGALLSDVFLIPPPVAYGANGEIYEAGDWMVTSGAIAFDFDDSALPDEAFPYELDPTTNFAITVGGNDGITSKKGANYPPFGGVLFESTSGGILAARKKVTGTDPYQVYNAHVRWNTGPDIDDDAAILAAWVRLEVDYKDDVNNRALTADWHDAGTTVDATDYAQDALQTANFPGELWDITAIGASAGGTANYFDLYGVDNGISRAGYTGLRFHVNGGSPTGSNQVRVFSFEGTGTEPRLAVNWLPKPTLESPGDGSTIAEVATVSPVLKAQAYADTGGEPIEYQFQIANDAGFTAPLVDDVWITSTNTYTVPPGKLQDGKTYYWRSAVRGMEAGHSSDPTPAWRFKVKLPKLGSLNRTGFRRGLHWSTFAFSAVA